VSGSEGLAQEEQKNEKGWAWGWKGVAALRFFSPFCPRWTSQVKSRVIPPRTLKGHLSAPWRVLLGVITRTFTQKRGDCSSSPCV